MANDNQEYKKNVSEQSGIQGQRKEVNVENYAKTVNIAQLLKNIEFPLSKSELIQRVKVTSDSNDENLQVIKKLERIKERKYENVADVTKAAGFVH